MGVEALISPCRRLTPTRMSARVCGGLPLDRGDRQMSALKRLSLSCSTAKATPTDELDPVEDARVRRAAREILLGAVTDS